MIKKLFRAHTDKSVAILASGPTLGLYDEAEDIAIAVNGAALFNRRYHYFTCGDTQSPERPWFYASEKHGAHRIIASFLAPFDRCLYPDNSRREQAESAFFEYLGEKRDLYPLEPDYHYAPVSPPPENHSWFQYSDHDLTTADPAVISQECEKPKFLQGGTITAVAVQMAIYLGAHEIHLYGCSMDNLNGDRYAAPEMGGGMTNLEQAKALCKLIRLSNERGVLVTVHGESLLHELLAD